jgi:hypothetical protein
VGVVSGGVALGGGAMVEVAVLAQVVIRYWAHRIHRQHGILRPERLRALDLELCSTGLLGCALVGFLAMIGLWPIATGMGLITGGVLFFAIKARAAMAMAQRRGNLAKAAAMVIRRAFDEQSPLSDLSEWMVQEEVSLAVREYAERLLTDVEAQSRRLEAGYN